MIRGALLILAILLIARTEGFGGLFRPSRFAMQTQLRAGTDKWYKDGLQFSCTMCGACCSGTTGSVRFTEEEMQLMMKKVGIVQRAEFEGKYCRLVDDEGYPPYFELKEVWNDEDQGHDCVFLDRETMKGKALCTLYEARPLQCRTWPFWSDVVESPESWEKAKEGKEGCKGLGDVNGKLYTMEEIDHDVIATNDWIAGLDEEPNKA